MTVFDGEFTLGVEANEEVRNLLKGLNRTRRVKRKVDELIYGVEGEFYFEDDEETIVDGNKPPGKQPGLWCGWQLEDDDLTIVWDGSEKFYEYTEWLVYIIERVLKPRHYILNGTAYWDGESSCDYGKIEVVNNVVYSTPGVMEYPKQNRKRWSIHDIL